MAAAIFFLVEADQRRARNQDVAVDDGATNTRVPPDAHPRHQDAVFDVTEAVYADVRAKYAALHGAAGNDAARRDHRVERLPAATA